MILIVFWCTRKISYLYRSYSDVIIYLKGNSHVWMASYTYEKKHWQRKKKKTKEDGNNREKKKDKNIAYSSKYFFSSIFAIKTIKIFNYWHSHISLRLNFFLAFMHFNLHCLWVENITSPVHLLCWVSFVTNSLKYSS